MLHQKIIESPFKTRYGNFIGGEWKEPICPSSNDLRLFGLWKNGVSGSVCGLI